MKNFVEIMILGTNLKNKRILVLIYNNISIEQQGQISIMDIKKILEIDDDLKRNEELYNIFDE